MRAPEEIKKGLENDLACCAKCDYCYPTHGNPYGCEDRAYQIGVADDALAYIQQLEAAAPKWISVYTQMPKDGQRVLTVNGDGVMEVLYYDKEWPNIFCGCGGLLKVCNITHWMPLPTPPKEEKTC